MAALADILAFNPSPKHLGGEPLIQETLAKRPPLQLFLQYRVDAFAIACKGCPVNSGSMVNRKVFRINLNIILGSGLFATERVNRKGMFFDQFILLRLLSFDSQDDCRISLRYFQWNNQLPV